MPFVAKLFSSIKTSYLPALLTLAAAAFCTLQNPNELPNVALVRFCFFAFTLLNLVMFRFDKSKKNLLFVLFTAVLYIVLGNLQQLPNIVFQKSVVYDFLFLLTPVYIVILFYISPPKITFLKILFLLLPAVVVENLSIEGYTAMPDIFGFIALLFWVAAFFFILLKLSAKPSFEISGMFFACLCLGLGLAFVTDALISAIYFASSLGILFVSRLFELFYRRYKDPATGVLSAASFERDDIKKFPPKYSIAFFYIDNYAKLLKVFGSDQANLLAKMVILKIKTLDPNAEIYRLSRSEFCLVFFDSDVRQTYETMEEIRRLIASTEFVIKQKKAIKLTITPVVSERRRSDADAKAVLMRMHENFHQKYKFTQNVTFCEEIESSKKIRRTSSRS